MDTTKPYLRDHEYARALSTALDILDKYLTQGPPSREELYYDMIGTMIEALLPLSLFAFMLGLVGFKSCLQHRDTRACARVQTQLTGIEHNRCRVDINVHRARFVW